MDRILVLGAGAVGCSIASYLARAGRDVTVTDIWFHQIDALKRGSLRVVSPDEEFPIDLPALHIDELQRLHGPVDVGIIALKAYDTEWAYRLLEPYLANEGIVLSAQNGIMEDLLPRWADMSRVVGCVINLAAECFEPGLVNRTLTSGWPAMKIGELAGGLSARSEALGALLHPVGDVTVSEDILSELWSKLALNAMTNATGAVTGATTPVIWGDDRFVPIALGAAAEAAAVAWAAGISIAPVFGRLDIDDLIALHAGDRGPAEGLASTLREIASGRRGAKENKPSMLQDILKGRRTEVDYICGYVVAKGREFGVSTPVNERLAELVREVESGRREVEFGNVEAIQAVLPTSLRE